MERANHIQCRTSGVLGLCLCAVIDTWQGKEEEVISMPAGKGDGGELCSVEARLISETHTFKSLVLTALFSQEEGYVCMHICMCICIYICVYA